MGALSRSNGCLLLAKLGRHIWVNQVWGPSLRRSFIIHGVEAADFSLKQLLLLGGTPVLAHVISVL
jgi:hypothetical protein